MTKEEHKTFKVGDMVLWTAYSQRKFFDLVGYIVKIIPAGEVPTREEFPDLYEKDEYFRLGKGRKYVSYVVGVPRPRSIKHYWPKIPHKKFELFNRGEHRAVLTWTRSGKNTETWEPDGEYGYGVGKDDE